MPPVPAWNVENIKEENRSIFLKCIFTFLEESSPM